jgi:2,4-dienoyl-CoA reductase (NADPH2)
MSQVRYPTLFRPLRLDGLQLKNRITMAPLYLGYAAEGGTVSPLLLYHYRLMSGSGAGLIVIENASVAGDGIGSPRTLRCDHARYLPGLQQLAAAAKQGGSLAALQINHAGRFAHVPEPVAPSAVAAFNRTPRELTRKDITRIRTQYVAAALRVKQAGFDLVELHGGTGYLLAQFVSPRTNKRSDTYGGSLENRMRFPLEILKGIKDRLGDFPVGYRFLAEEWLPDGLHLMESGALARALAEHGVAYLSVMGGTYESFYLPEVRKRSQTPGYMVSLAHAVKRQVKVPVIAAGRISTPALAESILSSGKADLIGLARMLWVDPQWVAKAREGRERTIRKCGVQCDACMHLVMKGQPAFCPRWAKDTREAYRALFI